MEQVIVIVRRAIMGVISAAVIVVANYSPVQAAAPELLREAVSRGTLVGTYYAPADGKKHAAVVVLGGSEGGFHDADARRFAEHGYAALALAYFGVDPLPKQLSAIPIETVTTGIDWLAARPEVDPARIGIEGGSKGAELALVVASRDTRIRATAAIVPTALVWFGLAFGSGPETSSWSAKGIPLPYVPSDPVADAAVGQAYATHGTISFRDTFNASWNAASQAVRENAAIPVERIVGPILCVAGADDREWDSPGACRTIEARRRAAKHSAGDETVIEPDAGHLLPFSGTPVSGSLQAGPVTMQMGGTADGNGRGGADAFAHVLSFFARTLGQQ
jgi:acetyl esterase/lipase